MDINNLFTQRIIENISHYLNEYRANHGSHSILWNEEMAKYSKLQASNIIDNLYIANYDDNNFRFYNELIVFKKCNNINIIYIINSIKKTIDSWYSENLIYDYDKGNCNLNNIHFVNLVWRSLTSFSIGIANNSDKMVIVLNTYPKIIKKNIKFNIIPKIQRSLPINIKLESMCIDD